jgi:hypothetical protein
VIADITVGTDPHVLHHVRERPDTRSLTDLVGLAESMGMNEEG